MVPLSTTPLYDASIRGFNKTNINSCTGCSFKCRRFSSGKLAGIALSVGAIPTVNQVSVCGLRLLNHARRNVAP